MRTPRSASRSASAVAAAGLYFFWFRNLKPTAQCLEEDAEYDEEHAKPAAHSPHA